MSRPIGLALLLTLAALFLVMNRGAYKGYFADDEVDNLAWTPQVPLESYAKQLVTPLFIPDNFRPVGHFYFATMAKLAGLDFPSYIGVIHALHLFNAWLIWILARRLGAQPLSAAAGVVGFTFHMALFDALWKPMYVFDVLCATFCLASIILFIYRRWVLSFLAFYLAYKSKELAVMLPAVLAAYEWWLGERRWKPLLPFMAVSLSFGLQGIFLNPNRDNDYTFRFTLAALAKTAPFYAGKIVLVSWVGFAVLAAPFVTRNRRAWVGLAMAGLFLFPLLFLPGRLFSAYCYVPFTGLAVALSAVDFTSRRVQAAALAALLLWGPWDYYQMRKLRRAKLAKDDEVRTWMTTLGRFARQTPSIDAFVFAGAPGGFQRWGIEGAIKYYFARPDLEIHWAEDKDAAHAFQRTRFAMLTWDWSRKQLIIASRTPETPDTTYLKMEPGMPVWQLVQGWYPLERTYRWTEPVAKARLWRPAGATRFFLRVNIGAEQLQLAGPQQVTVSIQGAPLAPRRFTALAWQTAEWELAPAPEGEVVVEFRVQPPLHPAKETRVLGLAIGAFGFGSGDKP